MFFTGEVNRHLCMSRVNEIASPCFVNFFFSKVYVCVSEYQLLNFVFSCLNTIVSALDEKSLCFQSFFAVFLVLENLVGFLLSRAIL